MAKDGRPTATGPWICARCGRQFARPKQAHSCKAHNIDDHFRGKDPRLRSVFDALRRALARSGPLRVDAVESTINLVSKHHFGGIAVRREYLRVGFILNREIRHERIAHAERIGPRRVSHHVIVSSVSEVDAQLIGWLAEAQAMQAAATSSTAR